MALRSEKPDERARALESIIATYWKPVYKYLRLKWHKSHEEAQDLTQGFFTRALEQEFFEAYNASTARFRTFLRVCLDGYVANEAKAAQRLKRGGDLQFVPLDFAGAQEELLRTHPNQGESPEDYFDREWIRSLFSLAVEELEKSCREGGKPLHYPIFECYDLADEPEGKPSYQQLARQFGISESAITNYLAYTRGEFRRIVLEKLRELTASEEEFREEARRILGAEAP